MPDGPMKTRSSSSSGTPTPTPRRRSRRQFPPSRATYRRHGTISKQGGGDGPRPGGQNDQEPRHQHLEGHPAPLPQPGPGARPEGRAVGGRLRERHGGLHLHRPRAPPGRHGRAQPPDQAVPLRLQ